jgi:hypothetical protein
LKLITISGCIEETQSCELQRRAAELRELYNGAAKLICVADRIKRRL